MAKQELLAIDNGATIIHQKQSTFNGYEFLFGFRGGAKLDGKYWGLSHLIEHLIFRESETDFGSSILDNMLKYSINQGAYTSEHSICVTFSAVDKNVEHALNNFVKSITNRKFTQAQIDKEIEVIKHEITMHMDMIKNYSPNGMDKFLQYISDDEVQPLSSIDILGTVNTLKKITPEIIEKYMERYFTLENLVISVTSLKPAEKVVELLNKTVFPHIPHAQKPEYIIGYPEPEKFKPVNVLVLEPNANKSNIEINLLFRERSDYSLDINKEYAYGVIEEYIMNSIGGLLFEQLRQKNSEVYLFGLHNMDLGSVKFKNFSLVTSRSKLNETITRTCKFIKEIGENGFPEDKFNDVKNAIIDQNNAVLQKFKTSSASGNFQTLMADMDFIDYKEVMKNIRNMTYEEFNGYITGIYRTANVSVVVDGNFDTRKMYNIIEIEEKLGKTANSHLKPSLNMPRVELSGLTEPQPIGPTEIVIEDSEEIEYSPVDIDDNEM